MNYNDLSTLTIAPYNTNDGLIRTVQREQVASLRVYRPSRTCIVIGTASKPENELHVSACLEDGVPIYKRQGGGCAVVLDPGNVIVAVAFPADGVGGITQHFTRISDWFIKGLARVGCAGVYRESVSDLVIQDRKISGACMYRAKGLVYYAATLVVDPNLRAIERYLKHPPREPAYRRGRSHAEFMGSLSELAEVRDPSVLVDNLIQCLDPQDLL